MLMKHEKRNINKKGPHHTFKKQGKKNWKCSKWTQY